MINGGEAAAYSLLIYNPWISHNNHQAFAAGVTYALLLPEPTGGPAVLNKGVHPPQHTGAEPQGFSGKHSVGSGNDGIGRIT